MYEEKNNRDKQVKKEKNSMKSLDKLGSIDSSSGYSLKYKNYGQLFPKKVVKKRITELDNHSLHFGAL